MIAQGEHVLIRKPKPKDKEGNILLPDTVAAGITISYGRVVSVGPLVKQLCPEARLSSHSTVVRDLDENDFVVFDPHGVRELELDPHKDSELVCAHGSHIYCTITKEELEARKLPIP